MSPQDFGTHLSNLTTRSATRTKAGPEDEARYLFFDSMVMYGWLANCEQEVTCVNRSLLDWMRNNGHGEIVSDLLAQRPVGIRRFLSTILGDPEGPAGMGDEIGKLVEDRVNELIRKVQIFERDRVIEAAGDVESYGAEDRVGDYFVQETLHVLEEYETVLAGLRVIRPGAIRMNSPNKRDRVDIITVCQIENSYDGKGWQVVGIQGQLQQSWLRVKARIEAGTQAGTVGLMGRNMSHNIGSHALFYLEVEETNAEKQRFYRYLRERMELLAGFSTVLSLSATTEKISKVIEVFRENTALLSRIARSENVSTVNIEPAGKFNAEVALPAGILGAQAFYTILENNIRDSAKHGRGHGAALGELNIRIEVREPEDKELAEDYYEVVVSDDRKNYADASKNIEEVFARLSIVNELGELEQGNWGIKERFIAAAILRGIRLETISVEQDYTNRSRPVDLNFGYCNPKILRVVDVNGNLGWAFYLMKPKEVLLISDSDDDGAYADTVTVKGMDWLEKNIDKAAEIRHRFVVMRARRESPDGTGPGDVEKLLSLEDKLPHRLFVCPPGGVELPACGRLVPIDEQSLEPNNLSPVLLYSKWVAWLVAQKKERLRPHTSKWQRFRAWLSDDESFVMPELVFCDAGQLSVVWYDDDDGQFKWKKARKDSYRPNKPILLVDRHGTCKVAAGAVTPEWVPDSDALKRYSVHYETHQGGDAVRELAYIGEDNNGPPTFGFACTEAALIRILIVDERLDPVSRSEKSKDLYEAGDGGAVRWRCTKHELFNWKGVDIRGEEYGGIETVPGRETLLDWVRGQGYDFMVLHKGIVDKLVNHAPDKMKEMRRLFADLKEHVGQLVIHTGRMSWKDLPEGCKFMALSNVDAWLRNNSSKVQIVEDICLLRRV